MKKTVYLTTTIPYVNGAPHVGYALEVVQADALARYHRLSDHDTYLLTGTDENAIKNVETAEKLGMSTQEMVDQLAEKYLGLREVLNFSFDQFIRTTAPKHKASSQKMWKLCEKDIYKKSYEGLYCVGCETFYKDGEFPDNICPEHNRKLEIISEVNYFFNLSNYLPQISKLIKSDELKIYPEFRKNEVLAMVNGDLQDFSISRPTERTKGWGIPVPGDEAQRIYVWFDALINYLSALDFDHDGELYKQYWLNNENRYHIVGKNVIKFHAIYWIGMLLSAGVPVPKRIYVHGFINVEGKKMSKSLGNVVSPFDLVQKYGTDAVRYYFLREIPSLDDGDFSYSRMEEIYNSELANELGNMVMRITNLCEKDEISITAADHPVADTTLAALYENFQFNKIAEHIINKVKKLNKSIDDFAPWKKTPEERTDFLIKKIEEIRIIGSELQPLMPETAQKIIEATTGTITKITPLFPKK